MPTKLARLPKRLATRLRQLRSLRSETRVREPTCRTRGGAPADPAGDAIEQQLDLAGHARADDAQLPLGLRRRGVAGGLHSRTTTMCMRRGPCAPSSIACSMSPVRDGPVMVLTVRGMRSLP